MQVGPDPPLRPFAGLAAERAASKHALGDIPLAILVRGLAEDMGPDNTAATEAIGTVTSPALLAYRATAGWSSRRKTAITCIWISPTL